MTDWYSVTGNGFKQEPVGLPGNAVNAGHGVCTVAGSEPRHIGKRRGGIETGHAEQGPVQNAVAVRKGVGIEVGPVAFPDLLRLGNSALTLSADLMMVSSSGITVVVQVIVRSPLDV